MTMTRCWRLWVVTCVFLTAFMAGLSSLAQNAAEGAPDLVNAGAETTTQAATPATDSLANSSPTSSTGPANSVLSGNLGDTLSKIWNATLFTAGGSDIKLNQLIIALMTLIIGLFIAKRVTNFINRRLIRVSNISEIIADTLSKIIYYIAAAVVVLIAMQVAGIPTTVFTVLGGALAIGVGFGAQNLFNNLISGIIILAEKPIRRNDIVVIDGMEGMVAEISNRRTRIRTSDGIDVLVPNSTFLESNVINWTLHDAKVRGHVSVGVAYGSPVKQVRDLLIQAGNENAKVEKSPPPIVLFTDFADNTLNFSLYFWVHVHTPLDRRQIESDLRFRIDELFNQFNISIAFPQRDVHLNTVKPLEVRVIDTSKQ